MTIDPEVARLIIEAIGLLITMFVTLGSVIMHLNRRFSSMETKFLTIVKENAEKTSAIERLVIRHETILSPEFNGGGKFHGGRN